MEILKPSVILTRPAHRNEALRHELDALGFDVKVLPLLDTQELQHGSQDKQTLTALRHGAYSWLAFQSQGGVRYLNAWMEREFGEVHLPPEIKIAVQGPATGDALKHLFNRGHDLIPAIHTGEEFGKALLRLCSSTERILVITPVETVGSLKGVLEAAGLSVDSLAVYETTAIRLDEPMVDDLVHSVSKPVYLTLFSPSAVHSALTNFKRHQPFLKSAKIVSVGPTTSEAVRSAGLEVAIEANPHSEEGVVSCLSTLVTS